MKKHHSNASSPPSSHGAARLPLHRETVRIITGQDLALVAGGSSTILTEKTGATGPVAAC